jgi:hypothetical protein
MRLKVTFTKYAQSNLPEGKLVRMIKLVTSMISITDILLFIHIALNVGQIYNSTASNVVCDI